MTDGINPNLNTFSQKLAVYERGVEEINHLSTLGLDVASARKILESEVKTLAIDAYVESQTHGFGEEVLNLIRTKNHTEWSEYIQRPDELIKSNFLRAAHAVVAIPYRGYDKNHPLILKARDFCRTATSEQIELLTNKFVLRVVESVKDFLEKHQKPGLETLFNYAGRAVAGEQIPAADWMRLEDVVDNSRHCKSNSISAADCLTAAINNYCYVPILMDSDSPAKKVVDDSMWLLNHEYRNEHCKKNNYIGNKEIEMDFVRIIRELELQKLAEYSGILFELMEGTICPLPRS